MFGPKPDLDLTYRQTDAFPSLHGTNMQMIYKILLPPEWDEFNAAGRFDGSSFDHESGFIHCSSRDQVAATAHRFFTDEPNLVVVALDADVLDDVRWEAAGNGEMFPHVYGPLTGSATVSVYEVPGAAAVPGVLAS